jgi:hypothetical protein
MLTYADVCWRMQADLAVQRALNELARARMDVDVVETRWAEAVERVTQLSQLSGASFIY